MFSTLPTLPKKEQYRRLDRTVKQFLFSLCRKVVERDGRIRKRKLLKRCLCKGLACSLPFRASWKSFRQRCLVDRLGDWNVDNHVPQGVEEIMEDTASIRSAGA